MNLYKLVLLIGLLISFNAHADHFSFAQLGYFGILGGTSNKDAEIRSYQGPGKEYELLYMNGTESGLITGLVSGYKHSWYHRGPKGPLEEDYESYYRFNGIKVGWWAKDKSGAGGQVLVTYGKGTFDFYKVDDTSPEITHTPRFLEFEARGIYPAIGYQGVNLDLYFGMRMHRILTSDRNYQGIQFNKNELSTWSTIYISYGIGVSY